MSVHYMIFVNCNRMITVRLLLIYLQETYLYVTTLKYIILVLWDGWVVEIQPHSQPVWSESSLKMILSCKEPGPHLNIKTVFPRYGVSHETVLSLTWESLYIFIMRWPPGHAENQDINRHGIDQGWPEYSELKTHWYTSNKHWVVWPILLIPGNELHSTLTLSK